MVPERVAASMRFSMYTKLLSVALAYVVFKVF